MKTISRDLKRDKQNLNLTTKETTETKQKPTGDCTVEQLIELKTEEEVNKLLSNQNNLNTHRIKLKNENDRPNATERTNLENDMNIQQMEGNKQAKVIESKGLQLTQQLQTLQETINSIKKEHAGVNESKEKTPPRYLYCPSPWYVTRTARKSSNWWTHLDALKKQVKPKWHIQKIEANANCLFDSISHLLLGNGNRGKEVREAITTIMENDWNNFKEFVPEEEREDYLDRLKTSETYGSELELRALANALEIGFEIHQLGKHPRLIGSGKKQFSQSLIWLAISHHTGAAWFP